MTGEVIEKKNQVSNNVLLVILGVLIILIIALIAGVVVHNTINGGQGGIGQVGSGEQTGIDELIAEVEADPAVENINSPIGAEIFSEKVGEKVENGELSSGTAYEYYQTMLDRVADESGVVNKEETGVRSMAAMNYAYDYALATYQWEGDEAKAREIMAKADPKNGSDKGGLTDDGLHFLDLVYAQNMGALCSVMGDEEGEAYYDKVAAEWKYLGEE